MSQARGTRFPPTPSARWFKGGQFYNDQRDRAPIGGAWVDAGRIVQTTLPQYYAQPIVVQPNPNVVQALHLI